MERIVVAEKVTVATAYTAGGSTLYFGLTSNDLGVFIGIIVGVLTYATNLWFKWDRRKREMRAEAQGEYEHFVKK